MADKVLRILSGGAAQGLVRKLQAGFEARHGCRLQGTFGAVGAMKEKLLAGEPCDVLILTDALVHELAGQGRVDPASIQAIGPVKTGVAVKEGESATGGVDSPEALRALLQAAGGIYFPDPAKATAGIHFMKVLQALELAVPLATRLHTFPNGATAMGELAKAADSSAVGCTQVTEILITPGVRLLGLLPPPHELATTYTASVATQAAEPALARALVQALCAPEAAATRRECGFG